MAPASESDYFKFFISCIRYSDNGKVDFEEVRKDCGIVSKGAAAKRYERMMKAHGLHQSQISTTDSIRNSSVPSRRKMSSHAAGPGKKRNISQYVEKDPSADNDEESSHLKAEGSDKKAKTGLGKQIKEEPCVKVETAERVEEEPRTKADE